MADHLEIEQKFDVGEDFTRPDFGALPGVTAEAPVTYHLAATYFDTPGTRLAANKITLRRRTGGTDEGWHLKLPEGAGSRRELHEPLGDSRDKVPERFASRVAEVTGGLPLAPIATLDTERTVVTLRAEDGHVVAEVADDVVSARRLGEAPGASRCAGGRSRSRCRKPRLSCSRRRPTCCSRPGRARPATAQSSPACSTAERRRRACSEEIHTLSTSGCVRGLGILRGILRGPASE